MDALSSGGAIRKIGLSGSKASARSRPSSASPQSGGHIDQLGGCDESQELARLAVAGESASSGLAYYFEYRTTHDVDACRLLTSPTYHLLRAWQDLPALPALPYLGTVPAYRVLR